MKTLQNNFTTPEQSKKLLELDLPADSADMCYTINDDTKFYDTAPVAIPYEQFTAKRFYLPCWSVGRLIEIFDICGDKKQCANELPLPSEIEEVYKTTYVTFLIEVFATGITCFDFSKLEE